MPKRRVLKAVIPNGLVRRATAVATAAQRKHAAEANALVDLVRARAGEIAGAFWDVGAALARLSDRKLYSSLGFATFELLCEERFGMSDTVVRKLITISSQLPREDAVKLKQERSSAVIELAAAKSVAAVDLLRRPVKLPGAHSPVNLMTLTANKIKEFARDERHAHGTAKGPRAAISRTADSIAAKLSKAMRDTPNVRVTTSVATRGDVEAHLKIIVPLSALAELAAALKSVARRASKR